MKQQINYKQYLASREWRVKRKEVIEVNNNICQRCASRPIENVHHLTYENIGDEDPVFDLMGVCHPCHEYLAAERDDDPALEVIRQVITEHGLFPISPWLQAKVAHPVFTSGELNGRDLWMELLPSDNDYNPDLPRKSIYQGVIAVFFWL
jgi:hypothetical protein